MSILKEHIGHMEKDQLNHHQSELTSFFLAALDFRAERGQVSPELPACSTNTLFPSSLSSPPPSSSVFAAAHGDASSLSCAGGAGEDGGDRRRRDRLSPRHGDEAVGGHVQAALLQGNVGNSSAGEARVVSAGR